MVFTPTEFEVFTIEVVDCYCVVQAVPAHLANTNF
jgi:hypothetical protein